MNKFLSDRPWIWIVLGMIVMLASLVVVIEIAVKHEPASVPLDQTHDGL